MACARVPPSRRQRGGKHQCRRNGQSRGRRCRRQMDVIDFTRARERAGKFDAAGKTFAFNGVDRAAEHAPRPCLAPRSRAHRVGEVQPHRIAQQIGETFPVAGDHVSAEPLEDCHFKLCRSARVAPSSIERSSLSTTPYESRAASFDMNSPARPAHALRVALERLAPSSAAPGAHDHFRIRADGLVAAVHHPVFALSGRAQVVASAFAGPASPQAPCRAPAPVRAPRSSISRRRSCAPACRCRGRPGTCPRLLKSRRRARAFTSTGHFISMPSIEPLRTSPWHTENRGRFAVLERTAAPAAASMLCTTKRRLDFG